MRGGGPARERPRGGLADKRRAILAAALTVFARDGYTRATIDAISAAAGVSTRTVYNHFRDKAQLFQTVIQESATRVAEAQIALVDRYLSQVTDLERDLIAFGRAWVAPATADFAEHFALVRQINAEAGHIPQAAIDAWQETGPLRVLRQVARRLQQLADRGLLRLADPQRAAVHFAVLTSISNPSYDGTARSPAEIDETVTAGVRAFLYGYLPPGATPGAAPAAVQGAAPGAAGGHPRSPRGPERRRRGRPRWPATARKLPDAGPSRGAAR
jgi:AcrR family transcriptional regulator